MMSGEHDLRGLRETSFRQMDAVFEKTTREMAAVRGWPICEAAMQQAVVACRRVLCLNDVFGNYFTDLAALSLGSEAEERAATAIVFNGTLTQENLAKDIPDWPLPLRADINTPQVRAILKRVVRRWQRAKYGKDRNPHFIPSKSISAGICVFWPTWLHRTDRIGGAAIVGAWQSKWSERVDTPSGESLQLVQRMPIMLDTFERARDRLGLKNPVAPSVSAEQLVQLMPEVRYFLADLRAQAKASS